LSLDLKELRPLSTYASEDDELVIVLDQPVASLKGQWQVTARGHHERYEGEFVHSAIAHRDFTSGMQKLLLDEDTSDNER
jgi:hypothetical protein